jgi:hypothetical protein
MKIVSALFIAFFLTVSIHAQRERSALLKGEEARRLAKQCSRDSPSDFSELWEPSADDIRKMEARLSDISGLRAKCCIEGASIEQPSKWYLQYAALVWHGKKIIYVSAIGRQQPTDFVRDETTGKLTEVPSNSWKEFAVIICDGGNAWGVVYDPKTGKFSDLSINGIG